VVEVEVEVVEESDLDADYVLGGRASLGIGNNPQIRLD
jgi:hypothetical protein